MLLKNNDGRQDDLVELNQLLGRKLSAKQRFLIDKHIKCITSGDRNENNSAYYLDFRFKDSPNWVIIHDLRLEHNGRVAQIDHLLINRFLDVYVLESKNYYYGVKITEEGEFLNWDGKGYQAIESPYEQNQRHIQALQQCIDDRNLAPRRLGFAIPINYVNTVLVSPTSKLLKPSTSTFDLSIVIKADALASIVEKNMDKKSVIEAAKLVGSDTLREFGNKLVRLHRPISINYSAKFGVLHDQDKPEPISAPSTVAQQVSSSIAAPKYLAGLVCRSCNSAKLTVMYGKFGYYFKCGECDGNTPIKLTCGNDGHSERIRKEGNKFFRECADCGSSALFFTNA